MNIKLIGKKGGIAFVNEKDFDQVSKYGWSMNADGYALATIEGISILMHHFVAKQYMKDIPDNQIIDHINRNRLDNRRENLRLLTRKLNGDNKSLYKNKKSSIYRGVYRDKKSKKYRVRTNIGGKRVNMGCYITEEEAAETMDMFLVHNGYDHVELNFPEKKDEYLKRNYVPYAKNKKSIYLGIVVNKKNFTALIQLDKKYIYIKTDKDEIVCAKAYDKYIVDNNVPGKKLNFPEDYPQYDPFTKIKTNFEKTDNDNIIRLILNSRPDKIVLIDKENYEKAKYYAWYIHKKGYVVADVKGKSTKLHHFIMNVSEQDILIDHIDSNILNNCKNNLRISDCEKNAQNKKKAYNASSVYYGVSFCKLENNWRAQIQHKHSKIYIGRYKNEVDAAHAYDLYIMIHLPSEHYKLNFDWTQKAIKKWKNKLYSENNPNKWIAKTSSERIMEDMYNIISALNNNKFFLLEKLFKKSNKKLNEKINKQYKELGI